MLTITKDWINPNIFHVLKDNKPRGYIEQFAPKEWRAYKADGTFVEWFTSKRFAANAVT